jgi:hypothetical protein
MNKRVVFYAFSFVILVGFILSVPLKAAEGYRRSEGSRLDAVQHVNYWNVKTKTDKTLAKINKYIKKYWLIVQKKGKKWFKKLNKEYGGIFTVDSFKKNTDALGKEIQPYMGSEEGTENAESSQGKGYR